MRARSWSAAHVEDAVLTAISCPAPILCVAVDDHGNVITSTDPTGGPAAWTVTNIVPPFQRPSGPENAVLTAVGCAALPLCVTGDAFPGDVLGSADPAGGATAWAEARGFVGPGEFVGEEGVTAATCPSTSLCVVASGGVILSSTRPLTERGSSVTTTARELDALACAAVKLCVAVDRTRGIAFVSTNPASSQPRWRSRRVEHDGLLAVSCPSRSLCVAVDHNGGITSSTAPSSARRWAVTRPDGANILTGVSCASSSLCIAVDELGNLLVGMRKHHQMHIGAFADAVW